MSLLVNRSLLFAGISALVSCRGEPKYPAPPAILGVAATVSASSPASALTHPSLAWVIARRWSLGAALTPALEPDAAPLPVVRSFYRGPVLGLVRCDSECTAALGTVLLDGAERAHLEQRILRTTEAERVDGLAIDASGLDEVDAAAAAWIEELAAAVHSRDGKVGVMVRMTCRDVVCNGLRLLGRLARAADMVALDEIDEDVLDPLAISERRRRAIHDALAPPGPTARVFLAEGEDRRGDARSLFLGGVWVGAVTSSPEP